MTLSPERLKQIREFANEHSDFTFRPVLELLDELDKYRAALERIAKPLSDYECTKCTTEDRFRKIAREALL